MGKQVGVGAAWSARVAMALFLTVDAGSAQAQTQEKFDLICDVRDVQTGLPYSKFHAQIDLQTMRWCEAPCTNVKELQSAMNILLLTSSAESDRGGFILLRRSIDRTTGMYEMRQTQGGRVLHHHSGQCVVRPYGSPVQRLF